MDWMKLLQEIFEVCLIPLLGILTGYLVAFIRSKKEALKETTDNEIYKKYIDMVSETVTACVIATNQTYVEALKGKNAFDAEAQKEAFRMTYEAVMAILTDDVKKYLSEIFGDLDVFITKLIEAQVNLNKVQK